MKKPITVTVGREHGNSGDVITTITDASGEQRKLSCPGDCSPYEALAGIRDQLAEVLNEPEPVTAAPPPPAPSLPAPAPSAPAAGSAVLLGAPVTPPTPVTP